MSISEHRRPFADTRISCAVYIEGSSSTNPGQITRVAEIVGLVTRVLLRHSVYAVLKRSS